MHKVLLAVASAMIVAALSGCSQVGFSGSDVAANDAPAANSAEAFCLSVSKIQTGWDDEFQTFRTSPDDGTGWEPLRVLAEKYQSKLTKLADTVDQDGISWDSGPIVSGMLSNAGSYMEQIYTSAANGYFSPGADLETLLSEIDTNLSSVSSSACN